MNRGVQISLKANMRKCHGWRRSLSLSVHMIVVVFVVVYLCLSWTLSLCGPGSVLVFTTAACQTLRQPSILTETTK